MQELIKRKLKKLRLNNKLNQPDVTKIFSRDLTQKTIKQQQPNPKNVHRKVLNYCSNNLHLNYDTE